MKMVLMVLVLVVLSIKLDVGWCLILKKMENVGGEWWLGGKKEICMEKKKMEKVNIGCSLHIFQAKHCIFWFFFTECSLHSLEWFLYNPSFSFFFVGHWRRMLIAHIYIVLSANILEFKCARNLHCSVYVGSLREPTLLYLM